MASDLDSYSSRYDQQNYDTKRGYAPRTFNGNGSIAEGPKTSYGTEAPLSGTSTWKPLAAPRLTDVNPYTDLSYNSFLRGMGLQQSQINAQTARQKSYLDQQLADQRPLWADQLQTGLKNISDSAEGRGVFRSGARLKDQNDFQANQSQQQTAYENSIQRQQQELGATAQERLMDIARQRADQELAARQRVAQAQVSNQVNPELLAFLQHSLAGK